MRVRACEGCFLDMNGFRRNKSGCRALGKAFGGLTQNPTASDLTGTHIRARRVETMCATHRARQRTIFIRRGLWGPLRIKYCPVGIKKRAICVRESFLGRIRPQNIE